MIDDDSFVGKFVDYLFKKSQKLTIFNIAHGFFFCSSYFDVFLISLIFPSALKATADALKEKGYKCAVYTVDISDKDQVYEVAKKVKEEVGKVDILVNNAGIVTCRTFLELPDKAIEKTYGVNILSHYWVGRFA